MAVSQAHGSIPLDTAGDFWYHAFDGRGATPPSGIESAIGIQIGLAQFLTKLSSVGQVRDLTRLYQVGQPYSFHPERLRPMWDKVVSGGTSSDAASC
jgi:hypothetical protein